MLEPAAPFMWSLPVDMETGPAVPELLMVPCGKASELQVNLVQDAEELREGDGNVDICCCCFSGRRWQNLLTFAVPGVPRKVVGNEAGPSRSVFPDSLVLEESQQPP